MLVLQYIYTCISQMESFENIHNGSLVCLMHTVQSTVAEREWSPLVYIYIYIYILGYQQRCWNIASYAYLCIYVCIEHMRNLEKSSSTKLQLNAKLER